MMKDTRSAIDLAIAAKASIEIIHKHLMTDLLYSSQYSNYYRRKLKNLCNLILR